jgi:hypothetical protein
MSKERTENSKYTSSFAPPGETIFIRGDQLLAEKMCARQAKKDGKALGIKFWNDKEWLKEFRLQLKHAKTLLTEHGFTVSVILKALEHRRCKNVYSLGLKSVLVPICKELMRLENSPKDNIIIEQVDINQEPRKPFVDKGSLRNKLRGI